VLPPGPGGWFYDGRHRLIYDAMLTLHEQGRPVDLPGLTDLLRRRGHLERAGGAVYLAELTECAVTTANVAHHARLVRDKALLRQVVNLGNSLVASGMAQAELPDILAQAHAALVRLAADQSTSAFAGMHALMVGAMHAAQHAGERDLEGLDIGFADLNALTGGLHASDLIVLAARPSMGKSALALQMAVAAARAHEALPVAVFTLEMSNAQLALRLLCAEARVDAQRVRRGFTSQAEWARLWEASERLHALPLLFDESAALTPLDVRARAKRLQLEQGLGMIVVDYLQLLTPSRRKDNRVQEVSEISRELKVLAKDLDVPVLALSQLSRAVEGRRPPVPQLSDLRDSGTIEQDADVVLFLDRGDLHEPNRPEAGTRLILAKQRNGPLGTVKLRFDGASVRFDALAHHPYHQVPLHGLTS
jgi:replicative DNA helicase